MRTLRLSLAGTVMLVLLAPSTVGLAQSADEPPTPGWVSGRLADVTLAGYVREVNAAGRLRVVEESFIGQQSADDPCLSGSVTTLATRDELNSAGDFVTVGMLMVENDEGAWRGRYSGPYDLYVITPEAVAATE